MKNEIGKLSSQEANELLILLKTRFEKNMHRHIGLIWDDVHTKLIANPSKLYALNEMEKTGGEPDVIGYNKDINQYIFNDCSKETPLGRRSVCYDREALNSRKMHKPENSAIDMANEMGIELLTEDEYRKLQEIEPFDLKTSTWILTPQDVRRLGGGLFCDRRYDKVFVYHNGADSYYAARGFRGVLKV